MELQLSLNLALDLYYFKAFVAAATDVNRNALNSFKGHRKISFSTGIERVLLIFLRNSLSNLIASSYFRFN